jgi:hypothetical protein
MDGNVLPSRKASPFAATLARLLDKTGFYSRGEWARFLGVTPSALSQWVNDRTVPRADLLRMIVDLLRTRGGEKAAAVLAVFDDLARKPATDVSPLGSRMSPTVHQYLSASSFIGLGRALRALPIEEQERVLSGGSWDGGNSESVASPVPELAAEEDETTEAAVGADVRPGSKIDADLLPWLEKVTSDRQALRRFTWEEALSGVGHFVVVGAPGTGKSHLMSAMVQQHEQKRTRPIFVMARSLCHADVRLNFRRLFEKAESGSSIFVDGLDEMSPEHRREAILQIVDGAHRASAIRVILTSRPVPELDFLDGFERFSVAPLSDMQIVLTLMRAVIASSNLNFSLSELTKFLCHLSERRSLVGPLGNPLLLKAAWALFEKSAVTPFSEIEVIGECIRSLLERDDRKQVVRVRKPWASPQNLLALLGQIAFQLVMSGRDIFGVDEVQTWTNLKFPNVPADELLSLLGVLGLVDSEDGFFSMSYHQYFRDYFAAQYVVESASSASSYLKEWPHRPDVREVLRLACGITTDATPLLRRVLDTSKVADTSRHVLLAEILAQPVVAEQKIVAETCDSLVTWLDGELCDWSVDARPSPFESNRIATWELWATGKTMGRAQQSVQGALTAIHRARSGPAREPLKERMRATKSPVLSAFATALDVEGRLDLKFYPDAGLENLRATVNEPQLG